MFPDLSLFWSPTNTPNADDFCADTGAINVTAYVTGGANCVSNANPNGTGAIPTGIYIQGDFANGAGDTDEFDTHVIAHEFGHYMEHTFARSDSIGGNHSLSDKLDLRVAFSEGWGDAFSGMALNDPVYRDSSGTTTDFTFNMETETAGPPAAGWYSERSVAQFIWDVFDSVADSSDNVSLGFTPIFNAQVNATKTTSALSSIFPFANYLRTNSPSASAAIGTLMAAKGINGTDDFASGETNNGGPNSGALTDTSVLPIYPTLAANTPTTVCTHAYHGTGNKLGNIKFFRLDLNATALLTVNVSGDVGTAPPPAVAATDPDVYLYKRGVNQLNGGTAVAADDSGTATNLSAGTYILEVEDFAFIDGSASGTTPHCMVVSYIAN